jgi:hypothetical protein
MNTLLIMECELQMAKYSIKRNTTNAQLHNQGPTNEEPEYDIDEIAACFSGRTRERQKPEVPHSGTSMDFSRWQELRQYLVRNKL